MVNLKLRTYTNFFLSLVFNGGERVACFIRLHQVGIISVHTFQGNCYLRMIMMVGRRFTPISIYILKTKATTLFLHGIRLHPYLYLYTYQFDNDTYRLDPLYIPVLFALIFIEIDLTIGVLYLYDDYALPIQKSHFTEN